MASFSVLGFQAQLTLMSRLDRETLVRLLGSPVEGRVRWPLVVEVSDQRAPALTSTRTLFVTVTTPGPEIPAKDCVGLTIPNKAPAGTPVQPVDIKAVLVWRWKPWFDLCKACA